MMNFSDEHVMNMIAKTEQPCHGMMPLLLFDAFDALFESFWIMFTKKKKSK